MFSLSNFTEYNVAQSLKDKDVLVWSKKSGYYFMTFKQAQEAYKNEEEFIIKGVEK